MTLDLTTVIDKGMDTGYQRGKIPVWDFVTGSGNTSVSLPHKMREILVANDSSSDIMTIILTGPNTFTITLTLLPGDILDERFSEFDTLAISATGSWRYILRSGRVE